MCNIFKLFLLFFNTTVCSTSIDKKIKLEECLKQQKMTKSMRCSNKETTNRITTNYLENDTKKTKMEQKRCLSMLQTSTLEIQELKGLLSENILLNDKNINVIRSAKRDISPCSSTNINEMISISSIYENTSIERNDDQLYNEPSDILNDIPLDLSLKSTKLITNDEISIYDYSKRGPLNKKAEIILTPSTSNKNEINMRQPSIKSHNKLLKTTNIVKKTTYTDFSINKIMMTDDKYVSDKEISMKKNFKNFNMDTFVYRPLLSKSRFQGIKKHPRNKTGSLKNIKKNLRKSKIEDLKIDSLYNTNDKTLQKSDKKQFTTANKRCMNDQYKPEEKTVVDEVDYYIHKTRYLSHTEIHIEKPTLYKTGMNANFCDNFEEFNDNVININKIFENVVIIEEDLTENRNLLLCEMKKSYSFRKNKSIYQIDIKNIHTYFSESEMRILDFKTRFMNIFLCAREMSQIKKESHFSDIYKIKKSRFVFFIFFFDLLNLLNIIDEELVFKNIKAKYFNEKNWEKYMGQRLDYIYEGLDKFIIDLNKLAVGVKSKINTQHTDLMYYLNDLVFAHIDIYKDLLKYFLEIYKFIYNVKNADHKLFINYRYENKKGNNIDNSLHHIHRHNKLIKTNEIDRAKYFRDFSVNDSSEIKLTNLYFFDFMIQQIESFKTTKNTDANTYTGLKKKTYPLYWNLRKKFIQNLFFFAILDIDFCDFLNLKLKDACIQLYFYENIFPVNNNYSFLFNQDSFKNKFFDKMVDFEKKYIKLLGNKPDFNEMGFGMDRILTNEKRYHKRFFVENDDKTMILTAQTIIVYEINFILNLLINQYFEK